MTEADYEYRGLMARAWDALRGDTSGWDDAFFYLEVVRRFGQPVLDVACGTGRLLLDFAGQGIDIDGVDVSPEMLAICREKLSAAGIIAETYLQAIEDLALPRNYRTVLVPSSSFQLLTDPGIARQGMQRLVGHLLPGGGLAMPFMTLGDPEEEQWESEAPFLPGGLMRRRAASRFDPASGLEHTEDWYELWVDGKLVESEHHKRSPATRSYHQDEARRLYEAVGLVEIQVLSGFTFQPAQIDERLFTLVGRLPEGTR